MRLIAVLACVAATRLAAQQPEPIPLQPDTARVESTPPPPAPPTPEQERYLLGLRSAVKSYFEDRGRTAFRRRWATS